MILGTKGRFSAWALSEPAGAIAKSNAGTAPTCMTVAYSQPPRPIGSVRSNDADGGAGIGAEGKPILSTLKVRKRLYPVEHFAPR